MRRVLYRCATAATRPCPTCFEWNIRSKNNQVGQKRFTNTKEKRFFLFRLSFEVSPFLPFYVLRQCDRQNIFGCCKTCKVACHLQTKRKRKEFNSFLIRLCLNLISGHFHPLNASVQRLEKLQKPILKFGKKRIDLNLFYKRKLLSLVWTLNHISVSRIWVDPEPYASYFLIFFLPWQFFVILTRVWVNPITWSLSFNYPVFCYFQTSSSWPRALCNLLYLFLILLCYF